LSSCAGFGFGHAVVSCSLLRWSDCKGLIDDVNNYFLGSFPRCGQDMARHGRAVDHTRLSIGAGWRALWSHGHLFILLY
jgi:hypothetical protein